MTASGLPRRLGDYHVVEELGHGAATTVLHVRAAGSAMPFALKTPRTPPEPEDHDAVLGALRREAALLGAVGPPAVPAVHEVAAVDGRPYLVMELVEGRTLDAVLAGGPLSVARTLAVAHDLARALAAIHRLGLVHRDLKPSNVLVTDVDDPAALAERLRAAVGGDPVRVGAVAVPVSISVGVAIRDDADDLDTLLGRADAALYRAKAAGRDRVATG